MNIFRRRRKQPDELSSRERDAARVDEKLAELKRRVDELQQVETVITVKTVRKR